MLIDTDIGTDIDDAYALAYACKQPAIELVGITTVSGNSYQRALIGDKLCRNSKRNIPIAAGINGTQFLSQKRWIQDYSPSRPIRRDAPEFILEQIAQFGKDLTLVAIGPLSNIARVLEIRPSALSEIGRFVFMGGAYHVGYYGKHHRWFRKEYNMNCDLAAAQLVIKDPTPKTMVGLDVTHNLKLTRAHEKQLKSKGSALVQDVLALHRAKNRTWMRITPAIMFDPLTIAEAAHPQCEKEALHVHFDQHGVMHMEKNPQEEKNTIQVCTSVDSTAFLQEFMEVLLSKTE